MVGAIHAKTINSTVRKMFLASKPDTSDEFDLREASPFMRDAKAEVDKATKNERRCFQCRAYKNAYKKSVGDGKGEENSRAKAQAAYKVFKIYCILFIILYAFSYCMFAYVTNYHLS